MIHLEEWSLLEKKYAKSISGTAEALNATILRLPVCDGAMVGNLIKHRNIFSILLSSWISCFSLQLYILQVDIQSVKNAVGSAIDVMQTIGNSISTLLSKVPFYIGF